MSYAILISNFHRHGGGQRVYVHILACHLLRFGHRPLVACPRDSFLARDCRKDGIETLDRFDFGRGFTPVSFSRDVALALRVRSENRLDLIHANGSRDHWVMAAANLLSREKLPLVRTLHNTNPVKNHFLNRYLHRECAHGTISVCNYVKEMLEESPVFEKREISVIHNGVDTDKFAPIPPDPELRKELGISETDIVIGLVGRLDWDKGHKYLFEAAAPLINGKFANIKIIAVGFGKELERLKQFCEQLRISRNVVFAGQRNDIREIISIFDIGVQPSIAVDTSSYSMKEIMAMQKPVVCSSYGGLKEIAEDGVTGYIVPPRDSDSLRERIAELCRSREMREQMGKAGRRRVEQEFSAKISVQKTLEVYRRTIEGFRK